MSNDVTRKISDELKPCPLCHSTMVDFYEPEEWPGGWVPYCIECGCEVRPGDGPQTKKIMAVRWNTRAQPKCTMSEEELCDYIASLKVGERVIETGKSCMTGEVGTVYISDSEMTRGAKCVMWELYKGDTKMGTGVTWGTRRIKDVLNAYNTLKTEKP